MKTTRFKVFVAAAVLLAAGLALGAVFLASHFGGGAQDALIVATDVPSASQPPLPETPKVKPPPTATPPEKVSPKTEPPKTKSPKARSPDSARPAPEEADVDPDAPGAGLTGLQLLPAAAASPSGRPGDRSRTEIEAQIAKAGKEPPQWWDSVKLAYPATLDLTGAAASGRGSANRGLTRYFHSNLDHNPSRHKEGCKLLHQIVAVNKDNKSAQVWAMQKLGQYYGQLLHDYARGVFWYRKAAEAGPLKALDVAILASCYGKLGSREMALAELDKARQYGSQAIRVLAEIGEVAKALDLAKQLAARTPAEGNVLAGDICRFSGRYEEAIQYYQQVVSGAARQKRYQTRAAASIEAVRAMQLIDLAKIADGVYRAAGVGYRGPVTVEVTVKAGRIADVKVTGSREDWPLNAEVAVPAQIIEKQSVKGVDNVSAATFTAEAVINAAGKALGSGVKK
jgi:uncharacterized protein with FMN-binding domain